MAQPAPKHFLVVTDLDGTLLDHHTYAFTESLPGLKLLQQRGVPIIFCSAKTRAEQGVLRAALGVRDPFIVENGAAVVWERGSFRKPHPFTRTLGDQRLLEFARPYAETRRLLSEVGAELNLSLRGYGDLAAEEVARCTGLDLESARRAMRRDYSETLVTELDAAARERLRAAFEWHGATLTLGARFLSVSTATDKGRAVRAVADMFRDEWGGVVTVGIGDSHNDLSMLEAVDIPLLVQRPGGGWTDLPVDGVRRINGIGPRGWTLAARQLLETAG